MYRIPNDLNLSMALGEVTTQIRVGQFDLQCSFGPVNFVVESKIVLFKNHEIVGSWKAGKWPDPMFYEILNTKIDKWGAPDDKRIVLHFENGMEMHLLDTSNQYECIQISVEGDSREWII